MTSISEVTAEVQLYRSDIDGLRAMAVLMVVFFHAGLPHSGGGFLGVDVFFVISGYLITGIVYSKLQAGRFSFAEFYLRRVRRILPALFFVSALTVIMGWFISLPVDYKDLVSGALAALGSVANVYFWMGSGYFDTSSEYKPILHTWSLSVEEQFYLLMPAVMALAVVKFRRNLFSLWLVATAVMLIVTVYWSVRYPSAAFFLMPARSWEFLLGGLVALASSSGGLLGSVDLRDAKAFLGRLSALLGWSGLLLIVVSAALVPTTKFYGIIPVLLAALGAALYLGFAPSSARLTALLSNRCLVLIGLASYSIYLWHQPLLAFGRQYAGSHLALRPLHVGSILLLSFALGFATWRYVESPMRRASTGGVWLAGFLFVTAAPVVGLWIVAHTDGARMRFSPEVLEIQSPPRADPFNCRLSPEDVEAGRLCSFGDEKAKYRVAVIGDSHARRLVGALHLAFAEKGVAIDLFADSWCVPLIGVSARTNTRNSSCERFIRAALLRVKKDPDVRHVVLAAQWPAYVDGWRYGDPQQVSYQGLSGVAYAGDWRFFGKELERTIATIRSPSKRVTVFEAAPEFPVHVPMVLARRLAHRGSAELEEIESVSRITYRTRNESTMRAFATVPEGYAVFESMSQLLCGSEKSCLYLSDDGQPLYEDSNHLSLPGAGIVTERLVSRILEDVAVLPSEEL